MCAARWAGVLSRAAERQSTRHALLERAKKMRRGTRCRRRQAAVGGRVFTPRLPPQARRPQRGQLRARNLVRLNGQPPASRVAIIDPSRATNGDCGGPASRGDPGRRDAKLVRALKQHAARYEKVRDVTSQFARILAARSKQHGFELILIRIVVSSGASACTRAHDSPMEGRAAAQRCHPTPPPPPSPTPPSFAAHLFAAIGQGCRRGRSQRTRLAPVAEATAT